MAATIAATNDAPAPQTFTLHIISPSLGSHGPFSFPNLPTATTVQELKAKIRERVQTKPHDDHQRLIHRGRQLTEDETMAEIFGRETLSNEDSQSLHLVLRPPAQDPPPYMPTPQPHTTQQNSQAQPATPRAGNYLSSQQPQRESTTTYTPAPVGPTNTDAHQSAATSSPMVYILSTPSGPQALLLSNASSYYTSLPTATAGLPHIHPAHTPHQPGQPIYQPQHFQPQPQPHPQARRQAQLQAQQHGAQHHAGRPDGPVLMGHQGNPAAAGALAAQLAPHIWLVIRLIGFVWFFTSGNTSWWRFCMITGLSVIFFIINTGVVNWAPIRRHLENLIPLAMPVANPDGAAAGQPAEAGAGAGTGARAGELDPQRVAQRLVQQRQRQNAGWFMSQVRRVEHATLLFLASLWPGVGERHVAAREEEDQAQRRREEAAEAERVAAEEAAREAEQPAAGEGAEANESANAEQSEKATDGGGSIARELLEVQGEVSGEGSAAMELPETQGDGGVSGPNSQLARDW
ncbi:hypothetical protein V494_02339 [Pseudogymnoascus sp. VKM F-4513 (FW-928)]|nr:hypothetical protein V494_02339 [Pseudogymnoascus sp. VKM F-4513 (FW-928)]